LENWTLFISLLILLFGVFILRKLWLGALLAILVVLLSKAILLPGFDWVLIPAISGTIISLELAVLLFGAYMFYITLYTNKHFSEFIDKTSSFSSKLFVLLILCVFMGGFMEGIAGFGIPAMLIAPLLLTLGFKPLTSIVLPLAANTTAVTFGALGTPFKLGLGIMETDPTVVSTLILNCLPALALPFVLTYIYSKTEEEDPGWKKNWKMLLGAGFSYAIPYMVTGLFSIEFPSVAAGFIGLVSFVFFFVPENEKPSPRFWLNTFYPYFLFVLLLLIARYMLSDLSWNIDISTRALSLYQPGLIFILTTIIYLLIIKKDKPLFQLYKQSRETFVKTGKSVITIFLLVCLTQLIQGDLKNLINSHYLGLTQTTKLLINPFIGTIGSFISGSATMSNLLFGSAIKADISAGNNLPLFLALLHTGSSIGNAITLQNIIMVKSVVDQPTIGFSKILKYNFLVVAIYSITIIVVAFLMIS
jgi:lactate permease